MKFVKLPAGEFTMGSPASEEGHTEIETQRKVRITKPFYLGQHEVTVGQFRKFVTETGFKTRSSAMANRASALNPRSMPSRSCRSSIARTQALAPTNIRW